MRISDWSSDVCSSDLEDADPAAAPDGERRCRAPDRPLSGATQGGILPHGLGAGALPCTGRLADMGRSAPAIGGTGVKALSEPRSEEHTSELQSLMRISYAVFCLKKKNTANNNKQKRLDRISLR